MLSATSREEARCTPPVKKLAFEFGKNEYDIEEDLEEPRQEVIYILQTYEEMIKHFQRTKNISQKLKE